MMMRHQEKREASSLSGASSVWMAFLKDDHEDKAPLVLFILVAILLTALVVDVVAVYIECHRGVFHFPKRPHNFKCLLAHL